MHKMYVIKRQKTTNHTKGQFVKTKFYYEKQAFNSYLNNIHFLNSKIKL